MCEVSIPRLNTGSLRYRLVRRVHGNLKVPLRVRV